MGIAAQGPLRAVLFTAGWNCIPHTIVGTPACSSLKVQVSGCWESGGGHPFLCEVLELWNSSGGSLNRLIARSRPAAEFPSANFARTLQARYAAHCIGHILVPTTLTVATGCLADLIACLAAGCCNQLV